MANFWHEIKDWVALLVAGFVTFSLARQQKAEDRLREIEKNYVTRNELSQMQARTDAKHDKMDAKLDRIIDKLEGKADK